MFYAPSWVPLIFNRLDSFGPNFIYCSKPSCTLRSMMCASTWSSPIASYIWYVHSVLYFPFLFISSPCPIPDKMLISGGNSVGNHWNKIACTTNSFWLIPWGKLSSIQLKNEGLVSQETVAPRRWESETLKFGIKQVDEGQISIVKRYRSWRFDR